MKISRRTLRDIAFFSLLALAIVIAAIRFDVLHRVIGWAYAHDTWELDDVLTLLLCCTIAWILFSVRRWNRLMEEISDREQALAEKLLSDQGAGLILHEAHTVRGLVPMCAWCKSVRDRTGYWLPLEEYLEEVGDTAYSHVLCPECARRLYQAPPLETDKTPLPVRPDL